MLLLLCCWLYRTPFIHDTRDKPKTKAKISCVVVLALFTAARTRTHESHWHLDAVHCRGVGTNLYQYLVDRQAFQLGDRLGDYDAHAGV